MLREFVDFANVFNLLVFILILRMEICEGGAVRQFPEHPGVDPNEKRNGYRG